MRTRRALLLVFFTAVLSAQADPFFPDTRGTTWEYDQTGAEPFHFSVRVAGSEPVKGKELLKLETVSDGQVVKTELIAVNEHGVAVTERRTTERGTIPFDPARVLIPIPLQVGTTWQVEDEVAGSAMYQEFKALAEENITVPAGVFRAYHLHCEQPWPISVSIDRWFAPGTGFIKELTTTRGPGGRLLSRVTRVLTAFTSAPPEPEPPPSAVISAASPAPAPAPAPKISVAITKDRDGEATTHFPSDAPNIFVRWQGENLSTNSTVRVAWIAEDVGDVVEPNFIIDETETDVTAPDFGARFTLSRPKDGWAAGKYRLEVYLDDELTEKVAVSIEDEPPKKP